MGRRQEITHGNPRAGKKNITIGTLEQVLGVGLAGLGVWAFFDSGMSSEGTEYLKFLSGAGGVAFAIGFITKAVGRYQHWYNNKTYDD